MASTLRRLMAEKRMSQTELAARSGVARELISKLVNGKWRVQNRSIVGALAWGLDVDVRELADLHSDLPLGPRRTNPGAGPGDRFDPVPLREAIRSIARRKQVTPTALVGASVMRSVARPHIGPYTADRICCQLGIHITEVYPDFFQRLAEEDAA